MDSPLGFELGQNGVVHELSPLPDAEGMRLAWRIDKLRPLATGMSELIFRR
jgi:hypothetical protein